MHMLGQIGDCRAPFRKRYLTEIKPVDEDYSAQRRIQTENKFEQSRFAGTARSSHCDDFAWFDGKLDSTKCRLNAPRIAKDETIENDMSEKLTMEGAPCNRRVLALDRH